MATRGNVNLQNSSGQPVLESLKYVMPICNNFVQRWVWAAPSTEIVTNELMSTSSSTVEFHKTCANLFNPIANNLHELYPSLARSYNFNCCLFA
eukprot:5232394-Amphidinium_carterae.1